MFVRRSARAGVLPALVLSLALAGCGGDDEIEPKMPDSNSAASTNTAESPSPTEPVEPTLPPEAEGDGAAAAEAFVRHYYDYVNYAQATGDTTGLEQLALRGCIACEGGVKWINDIHKAGGRVSGGVYAVDELTASRTGQARNQQKAFLVEAEVTNSRQRVSGANSQLNKTYPASTVSGRYFVVRGENAWRMARWEIAE